MIRLIFSVLFLLGYLTVESDYMPLALHELIIKSDKIVYGKIVDLDATHFTFKINGSLTNDHGEIRVRKFQDWMCAWRWKDYARGDEQLMFLREWDNDLVAMGAGNEGELPLVNDSIIVSGFSLLYMNGGLDDSFNDDFTFPSRWYEIQNDSFLGSKMKFSEFINDVKFIRQNIIFDNNEYHLLSKWVILTGEQEIMQKANTSLLINAILRETIKMESDK